MVRAKCAYKTMLDRQCSTIHSAVRISIIGLVWSSHSKICMCNGTSQREWNTEASNTESETLSSNVLNNMLNSLQKSRAAFMFWLLSKLNRPMTRVSKSSRYFIVRVRFINILFKKKLGKWAKLTVHIQIF